MRKRKQIMRHVRKKRQRANRIDAQHLRHVYRNASNALMAAKFGFRGDEDHDEEEEEEENEQETQVRFGFKTL